MAVFRIPRAVDAVAIALSRDDAREIAVPNVRIHLIELHPGFHPAVVKQAQLHLFGDFGEDGEVGAVSIEGCTEGICIARPH